MLKLHHGLAAGGFLLLAICLLMIPVGAFAAECGGASWYGPGFHGRTAASGERFNQNDMTAAHKTLPFGTRVRVTDRRNGRSVTVRINDRGPFVRGRVIDLSKAAATKLGSRAAGVVPVCIKRVK